MLSKKEELEEVKQFSANNSEKIIKDNIYNDGIEELKFDTHDFKVIVDGKKLNLNAATYIEIIQNYCDYIHAINYFGGFMFYSHMYDFFGQYYKDKGFGNKKGKTKIFEDIKKMEKLELIRTESVGQYNYVLLSKKALIYLNGRNNVPYIAKPTTISLMTNAYILDLALKSNIDIYNIFYNNFENYFASIAGQLYSTLLTDDIANNKIEYSYQAVNKLQNGLVHLERPKSFAYYLNEQLELSKLPIKKTKKIIEAKKKGKEEKTKIEHIRVTKLYDDITRLITKHVCFKGFEKLQDGTFMLHFIILDIDVSIIWIRNVLKEIDLVLNKLNAELKEPKIKGKVHIYTKDKEKEKVLFNKIKKELIEYKKAKKNALQYANIADDKRYYLIHRYNKKVLFYINSIDLNQLNTNRFFLSKGDVIKPLSENEISVVKISKKSQDLF